MTGLVLAALSGCMTMDGFFFNGTPVDAYVLETDVIPEASLELVDFPTEDGGTLYGVWARQPADAVAPLGPLLYFHGNADNIDHYFPKVEAYWTMGFDVFIFDYRGFGMSEGSPTFETVLADGAAAVDYVTNAVGVDSTAVPYLGLSLGGMVAVHTSEARPPSVLVTEDMFASAQKLIDDGSGLYLPTGWMVEDTWDNAEAASRVTRPYLIVHGAEDTYIQPEHAEEVYARANEPKRLWLVPGADHADASDVDPDGYAAQVTCWVAQDCAE
jgi:pimeloyl-ACP methyl ester carboxylesterase